MPISDPIQILLEHDQWATRQMLSACAELSPEQYHHRFEMGPGSLHDTTTHIVGAMRAWGDMLAGREPRPRLETTQRTPTELQAIFDEVAADFSTAAQSHPLDEIVVAQRGGQTYSFVRGAVVTHVMTHGMHHRAQCLNMLRQLGVNPLPPSSVLEWTLTVDSKR